MQQILQDDGRGGLSLYLKGRLYNVNNHENKCFDGKELDYREEGFLVCWLQHHPPNLHYDELLWIQSNARTNTLSFIF